jgi:hypothetical protein
VAPKLPAGRPRHSPSPEQRRNVQTLAGFGISHRDIGTVIGVSADTLRIHYRDELDKGQTVANANVAQNLYRIATGEGREAVTAAIFWLKVRAGWSEYAPPPQREEIPGKKILAAREADPVMARLGG